MTSKMRLQLRKSLVNFFVNDQPAADKVKSVITCVLPAGWTTEERTESAKKIWSGLMRISDMLLTRRRTKNSPPVEVRTAHEVCSIVEMLYERTQENNEKKLLTEWVEQLLPELSCTSKNLTAIEKRFKRSRFQEYWAHQHPFTVLWHDFRDLSDGRHQIVKRQFLFNPRQALAQIKKWTDKLSALFDQIDYASRMKLEEADAGQHTSEVLSHIVYELQKTGVAVNKCCSMLAKVVVSATLPHHETERDKKLEKEIRRAEERRVTGQLRQMYLRSRMTKKYQSAPTISLDAALRLRTEEIEPYVRNIAKSAKPKWTRKRKPKP